MGGYWSQESQVIYDDNTDAEVISYNELSSEGNVRVHAEAAKKKKKKKSKNKNANRLENGN